MMAWEMIGECLDRADWKEEVEAMMDLVQCPLSWGEAWRVLALGAGGLVVVAVAGWSWWRCRRVAGFRPLAGSSPILRREGARRREVREDYPGEQEATRSTLVLEESRDGQVDRGGLVAVGTEKR